MAILSARRPGLLDGFPWIRGSPELLYWWGISPDCAFLRVSSFAVEQTVPPAVPLRPPVQRYRPGHGMHHRRTCSPRLQQARFQPEIPLSGSVRIVNQHQTGIVLQSLSLQDHRLLVLPQELLGKDSENRDWQQQIPSRHKINPAKIAAHRGDRGPTGKP